MDDDVHPPGIAPTPAPPVPVLPPGAPLESGGVYLNLARPETGPFRALPGQTAGCRDRYVAQRDVGCHRWRRLVEDAAHVAAAESPRVAVP